MKPLPLLLLLLLPAVAAAQPLDLYVNVESAFNVQPSELSEYWPIGFGAAGGVGVRVARGIDVGAEASYRQHHPDQQKFEDGGVIGQVTSVSGGIYSVGTAALVTRVTLSRPLTGGRSYVLFGGGVALTNLSEMTVRTGGIPVSSPSSRETNVFAQVGIGFILPVSEKVRFCIEPRAQFFLTEDNTFAVPVRLGVALPFR